MFVSNIAMAAGVMFDKQPQQRFVGLYNIFEAPAVLFVSK